MIALDQTNHRRGEELETRTQALADLDRPGRALAFGPGWLAVGRRQFTAFDAAPEQSGIAGLAP
jgi:hypothetical protein